MTRASTIIFSVVVIATIILMVIVGISISKSDERYFKDDVWSQSACSSIEIENAVNPHPCYLLGSDNNCPLTTDVYTLRKLIYRNVNITFYMLSPNDTDYIDAFKAEINLMLGCHSIQFAELINTYGQPYILLLDDYKGSRWVTYTSGSSSCVDHEKRIVFPSRGHLAYKGVLSHEFAHYFHDKIHGFTMPSNCDEELYNEIVPTQQNDFTGKYNDGHDNLREWGDGMGWPYCYGLSDGSGGVPNRNELMAIITEGACAVNSSDARYTRVCGPSAEYLNTSDGESQHACLEELYGLNYTS